MAIKKETKEECPKDFDAKTMRIMQCEALLNLCAHEASRGRAHILLTYTLQDSLVSWLKARGFVVKQPRFSSLLGNSLGRISW